MGLNRRSFFRRIVTAAVAVAAAPLIVREVIAAKLPAAEPIDLYALQQAVYDLCKKRPDHGKHIEVWVDSYTADAFKRNILLYYHNYYGPHITPNEQ